MFFPVSIEFSIESILAPQRILGNSTLIRKSNSSCGESTKHCWRAKNHWRILRALIFFFPHEEKLASVCVCVCVCVCVWFLFFFPSLKLHYTESGGKKCWFCSDKPLLLNSGIVFHIKSKVA